MKQPKAYGFFVNKLPINKKKKFWLLRYWKGILGGLLLVVIIALYNVRTFYDTADVAALGESRVGKYHSLGYEVCFFGCSYNELVRLYTSYDDTPIECLYFSLSNGVLWKECAGIGGSTSATMEELNIINANRGLVGKDDIPILTCDEANMAYNDRVCGDGNNCLAMLCFDDV